MKPDHTPLPKHSEMTEEERCAFFKRLEANFIRFCSEHPKLFELLAESQRSSGRQ